MPVSTMLRTSENIILMMEDIKKEIEHCLRVLEQGGIILYPTDTVWGIGCDAANAEAVQRIFSLKQRSDSKTMICLVANDVMLERHVKQVPDLAFDIIDLSEKPVTIVYDEPMAVAHNLIAPDNTLAIRVARDRFCQRLISRYGKPIVSTSANISGQPTPKSYSEISGHILKGVDYVVNLHREKINSQPSSIIRLKNDGTVKVIRE